MAISSGLLTSGIQANSGWDATTSENLENIVEICRAPAVQPEEGESWREGLGREGRRETAETAGDGPQGTRQGLAALERTLAWCSSKPAP